MKWWWPWLAAGWMGLAACGGIADCGATSARGDCPPPRPLVPSWLLSGESGDPSGVDLAPMHRALEATAARLRAAAGDTWRGRVPSWREEPSFELRDDGEVEVSWWTQGTAPPGRVHAGVVLPDAALSTPVYRAVAVEEGRQERTRHQVLLPLEYLEGARVDIGCLSARGGTVHARVEQYDPVSRGVQLMDGRVAYHRAAPAGPRRRHVAITHGPVVDLPGTDGITVSFETDAIAHGIVIAWGADGSPVEVSSMAPSWRHELRITGLKADTTYGYLVAAVPPSGPLQVSRVATFRTAPASSRRVRFAVLSDSRGAYGGPLHDQVGVNAHTVGRLMDAVVRDGAEFTVFVGDLVNGYSQQPGRLEVELRAFRRTLEHLTRSHPIFEVPGNHDQVIQRTTDGGMIDAPAPQSSSEVFSRVVVNPQNGPADEGEGTPPYGETAWSARYGDLLLVAVNTNYWTGRRTRVRSNVEGLIMAQQFTWLDATLEAARADGVAHIFVFTHEPGFPVGGHSHDAMWWDGKRPDVNASRERFWRIVAKHGVVAVFHGDDHNYSRLRVDQGLVPGMVAPVWQVVTGGAGAPFYNVESHVPWIDRLKRFSARSHWVAVDVSIDGVWMAVYDEIGDVIERVRLDQPSR